MEFLANPAGAFAFLWAFGGIIFFISILGWGGTEARRKMIETCISKPTDFGDFLGSVVVILLIMACWPYIVIARLFDRKW